MLELTATLLLFAAGLLAPVLFRFLKASTGAVVAILPATLFGLFLFAPAGIAAAGGEAVLSSWNWIPELRMNLSFRLDGLSLLFALLITGIGALVLLFSTGYMGGDKKAGRFYCYLLLFMGAMLGLVTADNLLLMFVFWELTSITSFLLIGFKNEDESARKSAFRALVITVGSGLVLLAGIGLVAIRAGTVEFGELLAMGDVLRDDRLYPAILACFLIGAFAKSAQFPLHFWLPGAMKAPTPVSAYLHSSTMVQAGVYLLARMGPVLGGTPAWENTLLAVGGLTAVVGAILLLKNWDLKLVLAYSTVSSLGLLFVYIALGGDRGSAGIPAYLLAHALYKASMFLVAGALDHQTGTRDARRLGRLWPIMRWTAVAGVLAALSMAGLPPAFGFAAKELLLGGVLENFVVIGITVFAGGSAMAGAYIVGIRPFFGRPRGEPVEATETPATMLAGPVLLGILGILAGPGTTFLFHRIGRATAEAIAPGVEFEAWEFHLIPYGPLLWISLLAILLGAGLAVMWERRVSTTERAEPLPGPGMTEAYDRAIAGLFAFAEWQTKFIQNGSLGSYLRTILTSLVLLIFAALVRWQTDILAPVFQPPEIHEWAIVLAIAVAALTAVRSASRLGAVAALGIVGFGIAMIYVLYGAPDLAMTQIAVETLTVILFVFVFHHLPRFASRSSIRVRVRDGVIASMVGLTFAALVLIVSAIHPAEVISAWHAEQSVPAAHGRNVVNVILVDFRALDTLGEIAVLATAGLGVFALLKLGRRREDSSAA